MAGRISPRRALPVPYGCDAGPDKPDTLRKVRFGLLFQRRGE